MNSETKTRNFITLIASNTWKISKPEVGVGVDYLDYPSKKQLKKRSKAVLMITLITPKNNFFQSTKRAITLNNPRKNLKRKGGGGCWPPWLLTSPQTAQRKGVNDDYLEPSPLPPPKKKNRKKKIETNDEGGGNLRYHSIENFFSKQRSTEGVVGGIDFECLDKFPS